MVNYDMDRISIRRIMVFIKVLSTNDNTLINQQCMQRPGFHINSDHEGVTYEIYKVNDRKGNKFFKKEDTLYCDTE